MSRATYRTVAEILEQAKREEWPTSAFSARPSAEQHLIVKPRPAEPEGVTGRDSCPTEDHDWTCSRP